LKIKNYLKLKIKKQNQNYRTINEFIPWGHRGSNKSKAELIDHFSIAFSFLQMCVFYFPPPFPLIANFPPKKSRNSTPTVATNSKFKNPTKPTPTNWLGTEAESSTKMSQPQCAATTR